MLNKNISVWRGEDNPPSLYHLILNEDNGDLYYKLNGKNYLVNYRNNESISVTSLQNIIIPDGQELKTIKDFCKQNNVSKGKTVKGLTESNKWVEYVVIGDNLDSDSSYYKLPTIMGEDIGQIEESEITNIFNSVYEEISR